MFKHLKAKKAQASTAEYALTFFLVVGVMIAMTIYVRRALQARIRDARIYAVNSVETQVGDRYNGSLYLGYDPYYQNTESTTLRRATLTKQLSKGGRTGLFKKTYNEYREMEIFSNTAPPKEAD